MSIGAPPHAAYRTALSLLVLVLAACGRVEVPGSPPIQNTTRTEDLQLTLALPKTVWAAGEPITGAAALLVLDEGVTEASGSGSGLILFDFEELDGTRRMLAPRTMDCRPYRLKPGVPIPMPLQVSGGSWDAGDPHAEFYRQFLSDRTVRLPAGEWRISSTAALIPAPECAAAEVMATVHVDISVIE